MIHRTFLLFIFTFLLSTTAHSWPIKEKVLFYEGKSAGVDQKWIHLGKTPEESVRLLLYILEKSPSGKKTVQAAREKARKKGKSLESFISSGENSITDTTIIRHFSIDNPDDVTFKLESQVVINSDHRVEDAILDLAHELVHFVHKDSFNPYRKKFKVKDFILSTLESKGGEIEAYLHECAVMSELMQQRFLNDDNCQSVYVPDRPKLSVLLSKKAFFQMGNFSADFISQLGELNLDRSAFPELNSREARFISSAYQLPYPFAALKEYNQIMKKVCENDFQRFEYLKRSPASDYATSYKAQKAEHETRCHRFLFGSSWR